MKYIIKQVYGHVEVFDGMGEFQFSADTTEEALNELKTLDAA